MIIHNLCARYGGFDPITLQNKPFVAVVECYSDLARLVIRENNSNTGTGDKVIRRPAGDNWY